MAETVRGWNTDAYTRWNFLVTRIMIKEVQALIRGQANSQGRTHTTMKQA